MSVYARIEADIVTARKERDAPRLKILTLLISKIQRIAKDDPKEPNRPVREDDVLTGISRYLKEVEDMHKALTNAGRPTDEQDHEIAVVTAYLPTQMTQEELEREIDTIIAGTDGTKKAMGVVMKALNEGYRGKFNPGQASDMVKAKLK